MSGFFVSIDGVDGGGKSTQLQLLQAWFEERGRTVIRVRDPGGTKLGEQLREILLHRKEIPLSMTSEMLLYMASRAQLVEEIIRPSLAEGHVVLSDRFLLANVVYQGEAGGLVPDEIWRVGDVATGGIQPDLTFILDLDPEVSLSRIDRGLDRLESRGISYMRAVRNGFLEQSTRLPKALVIDASQDIDAVHSAIIAAVEPLVAS